MESWRRISDYPNYEVSNTGKVKNAKTGRVLKQGRHKQGYSLVWLCDNGVRHGESVHRLVAESFIPNPDGKPQVNHIDGNKSNNRVENLEWNTESENTRHAFKTDLFDGRPKKAIRIIETGEVFESVKECAKTINADSSNICACIRGRIHSCKGYHFEYI